MTVPEVVRAVGYTHFVSATGSATSLCTQQQPCSFTRAAALAGTASMPPGSTVLVRAGVYSQASLVFDGNGMWGYPIKFIGENGVRLTGTRFQPDESAWTLVPGKAYTYQLDWDEATNFTSSGAAQRPPVASWRPILVDDRRRPFTEPSSRLFYLDFPPRYTIRASIDQVEAQHCTHWHDTARNKIYVHMCDDTAPKNAANLYLSSAGWGSIVINGDFLWFENFTIEHATSNGGGGLRVNTSADWTTIKKINARASDVNFRGTNTRAEDIEVGFVISQGIDPGECYDANPAFGVGECWNAAGSGAALTIGVEDSSASFGQVIRRAKVHRSWNGGGVRGPNTLEDSSFWGFMNHTLSGGGTGAVIKNNVFLNGQDSIYFERNAFDYLTVEHNVFVNGVLFWVSSNGVGGVPPTSWKFRYNVAPAIVYDDKTLPAVQSDCNVFIPANGENTFLMKVAGTDGRPGYEYDTLTEIKARTPLEDHSVALPPSKWTDGTVFKKFTNQTMSDFDFSAPEGASPLRACGETIGPNVAVAPAGLRIIQR